MVETPGQLNRCQGRTAYGQCDYVVLEGKKFCKIHIANAAGAESKVNIRNYRIAKYRARLEELVENPEVKNIREEIGLLRILLEEEFNSCKTPVDLMMKSNKIADLIMRVEKLVSSCHRLEKATGMLLDKSAAIQLAAQFVDIITSEVKDPAIVERISTQLIKQIQEMEPTKDE